MNTCLAKLLSLFIVVYLSACKVSANQEELKIANHNEVKTFQIDCDKPEVPPVLSSPRPSPLPIPENWKSKSANEIYKDIIAHPCNIKLENDELIIKGYGTGPSSNVLTKPEKLDIAKRASGVDAYRNVVEMVLEIYLENNLKLRSFFYSPDRKTSEKIKLNLNKYIQNGGTLSVKITNEDKAEAETELRFVDFYKTISEYLSN